MLTRLTDRPECTSQLHVWPAQTVDADATGSFPVNGCLSCNTEVSPVISPEERAILGRRREGEIYTSGGFKVGGVGLLGPPPTDLSHFFSKLSCPVQNAYSSLWAFTINDDGTDTSYSVSFKISGCAMH